MNFVAACTDLQIRYEVRLTASFGKWPNFGALHFVVACGSAFNYALCTIRTRKAITSVTRGT